MNNRMDSKTALLKSLSKTPTGIQGLDEITGGGLPKGRPTLVAGGAGCAKTLLAMEFLVRGIERFDENGAFITFEETTDELTENTASLGFDLKALTHDKRLSLKQIYYEPTNDVETGDYDLSGLFVQIGSAIDSVKAQRVVIDGIENLFSYFSREQIVRAELKRLFRWLKEKGVTAIVTSEAGAGGSQTTRRGIEEYISDCVISLSQRILDQISIRRLHIIKYRGSVHGANEYPFLITEKGISVLPITSMGLEYEALTERVLTGIEGLDRMFEGKGYFKGSGILISGTAGTGKSTFAASFAAARCRKGGRTLYFSFEESAPQIVRNMQSIGMDLAPFVEKGLLKFHAVRPTLHGLEMHLLNMNRLIQDYAPDAVILDPISNLTTVGSLPDVKLMFLRILDTLKKANITCLCTDLTSGGHAIEATDVGVSSIMDTWVLLQNVPMNRLRERSVYILKSRGMSHSNEMHSFEMKEDGIHIQPSSE
jgi:circadian clock protein KaiC